MEYESWKASSDVLKPRYIYMCVCVCVSKSFLSVLTQLSLFVAIIILTGLCYMFEQ